MILSYGGAETGHLSRADAKLGAQIARIGMIEREVLPDVFEALVNAVVGQQISMKAADTVWARMLDRFGSITPERLFAAPAEDIQACGLSHRKAAYIKGIAEEAHTGRLDIAALRGMSDEQVVERLCSLNGIGVWTAEMLLIFSLQRPNVLSWGDLAIRRGIEALHGCAPLTREKFGELRAAYSPYCTVASLYLWEIAVGN